MAFLAVLLALVLMTTAVLAEYGTVSDIKLVTIVPEGQTPKPLTAIRLSSKLQLVWKFSDAAPVVDTAHYSFSYIAGDLNVVVGTTADLTPLTFDVDLATFPQIDTPAVKSHFTVSVIDTDGKTVVSTTSSAIFPTFSCTWEVTGAEYGPCISIYPAPLPPFIKGVCGAGEDHLPVDCIMTNGIPEDDVRTSGDQGDADCRDTNAGAKPDAPRPCDLGVCDNAGTCTDGQCVCAPEFAGQKCERASSCPTCVADNTLSCSPREGKCTCKYGFSGDLCAATITPVWPSSAAQMGSALAAACLLAIFF